MNERHHLTVSTIYYNKDSPTQIQIYETRNRFGLYDVLESKLVIGNTLSAQNSGNYRCVATTFMGEEKRSLTTAWVEIKILNKIDLKNIDALNKKEKEAKQSEATLYCAEIITQTYKGVYKWPKTLAHTKLTQKCASNSSAYVVFECGAGGEWADLIDLRQCEFKSNLTKYLYELTRSASNESITNLEEFIHKIVSIQSADSLHAWVIMKHKRIQN